MSDIAQAGGRSKYHILLDYLAVPYLLYFNFLLVVSILYEYVIDILENNNICKVIKESAIQSMQPLILLVELMPETQRKN